MDLGANTTWPDLDTNVVRKFSTMSGKSGRDSAWVGEEPHFSGPLAQYVTLAWALHMHYLSFHSNCKG